LVVTNSWNDSKLFLERFKSRHPSNNLESISSGNIQRLAVLTENFSPDSKTSMARAGVGLREPMKFEVGAKKDESGSGTALAACERSQ
jgi:hypothetical protein